MFHKYRYFTNLYNVRIAPKLAVLIQCSYYAGVKQRSGVCPSPSVSAIFFTKLNAAVIN